MALDEKDAHLNETPISSEVITQGNFLTVKRDQVKLPDGGQGEREYVLHPGAVVIIPLLPNGNVVFARQFRYPLHQLFLELPAGKIDPNEPHDITAKRELLEETGYRASEWVKLGIQHPCIGYSNEVIHIYLAQGLEMVSQQLDEGEFIEVIELPLKEIGNKIMAGGLTDSKTISAMYFAEKYLAQQD